VGKVKPQTLGQRLQQLAGITSIADIIAEN
jgi:hypothetical protein